MVPVFLCETALWCSIKLRELKSATQQKFHEGAAAGLIKYNLYYLAVL